MKAVTVIIVTYNSEALIKPCLDTIFAQDFKDYEVIVIDNASQDKTISILENQYQNIVLIKNPKNYGFSKAVNQGIVNSNGKFILCLNSDVRLKSDFLKNAICVIENNPGLSAIQPKVLKLDGKHIDTRGIFLSGLRRFYDIGKGEIDIDSGRWNNHNYIFGACTAAALYRKEALETIKQSNEYFDEDFFCLVEDVDISWRLQKRGWRMQYCPDAVCLHIGGLSRNNNNITQYYSMRNRYLMIIKNETLMGFLKFFIVFFLYDIWRNLYMSIVSPRYFLKATCETIELFPKMLAKRHSYYEN